MAMDEDNSAPAQPWPLWAVGSACVLGLLLATLHLWRSSSAAALWPMPPSPKSKTDPKRRVNVFRHPPKGFKQFQTMFLAVYLTIMLADWLQGTNMYTLYQSYGVDIGNLFITGFAASAVFGTFIGSLVDSFGRKRGCILFCLLEIALNILEHFPNMTLLLAGRVMGGISTSLLFSAFESWMVTEHRRRGFPEELLAHTFSLAAIGNGACAVGAGLIAQVASDALGDIGPFQVAIALTVLTLVLVCFWRENYGAKSHNAQGSVTSIMRGLQAIKDDGAVWRLGLVQSLFEGAMYTFVFMWVPTLQSVVPDGILPTGLVFTSFMLCITLGGTIFELLVEREVAPERINTAACWTGVMAMLVPVVTQQFQFIFLAFLVFEVTVGICQPALGTLRSRYLPADALTTIMNLLRLPLNILVVLGTTFGDKYSPKLVYCVIAGWIAIAAVLQGQVRPDKAREGELSRKQAEVAARRSQTKREKTASSS